MTVENDMYGGGWQQCGRCHVKDRPDQLVKVEGGFRHIDSKANVCAQWATTLAKASPADLAKVASPAPKDPVVADYHARKAEKLERQLRENAELKAFAGKPWVNKHLNGKAAK